MKIQNIVSGLLVCFSLAAALHAGTVSISTDVPATNVIVSDGEERATYTKIFDADASSNHGRGNSFTTPDGLTSTGWVMTGLCIRKFNKQTFVNDTLKLWIFEGTADQWAGGDGDADGDMLDGTGITKTLLNGESFTLNGTIPNNAYVTMTLESPISLKENTSYIWFAKYEQVHGGQTMFQLVQAAGATAEPGSNQLQIKTTQNTKVSSPNPLTHYVHGYATGRDEDGNPLLSAITALKDHIQGRVPLTNDQISTHIATINSFAQFIPDIDTTIVACFDLVEAYDARFGPLWVEGSSKSDGFTRSNLTEDIHWAIFQIMQHIMDYVYTQENVLRYENLLDGFKFGSSAHFPGAVPPPTDPEATYTVAINGSFPRIPYVREIDKGFARKPTGAYVAPGSIATVIVPWSLVGQGYQIRVGAYSWDHSKKPKIKRLDRVSLIYDINSTEVKVANPLGGGIYIEVPYLADAGIVDVQVKNAVRAPFFSAQSFHRTSLQEWQRFERHHPAPTADFQSDKFMMQVPTSWIYALDDPIKMMADWDKAMDTMNDLMGFPHIRGKETLYTQVDIQMRGSAYFPGYPTSNVGYDPDRDYGGSHSNYHITGPQNAPSYVFHEVGHSYLFSKFNGETESAVNLLHVAVWHQGFGYSLDDAFRASRYDTGYTYRTLETTAICWMMCENFYRQQPMDEKDKKYQLKGHAKYVDIARLFGWDVLGAYWKSINEDYENGIIWPKNNKDYDAIVLRMSETADVDLRPLLHFWGILPQNASSLASKIDAAEIPTSVEIYDTLVRYKSLVPPNRSAYQSFALGWWNNKKPRNEDEASNVYQTEAYHAILWNSYNETYANQIRANVQAIIDQYFPSGRPRSSR